MISIHHVGARGESAEIFAVPSFEDEFFYTLYEADAEAEVTTQKAQRHVRVVNACIGRSERGRDFHITLHPPSSSLLRGNAALGEFFWTFAGIDRPFSVERRIVRSVKVDTRPLSAALCAELGVAPPDVLVLDAQGVEGEILKTADPGIIDNLLGVVTEVHMAEIYENGASFGEVFDFLTKNGFYFVDYLKAVGFHAASSPVGFRGRGFFMEGDALFLKDVGKLLPAGDERERQRQRIKLSFISLLLMRMDYALVCLRGVDWADATDEAGRRPKYGDLMKEIAAASVAPWAVLPPSLEKPIELTADVLASWLRFYTPESNPVCGILKRYGLDDLAALYGEEGRKTVENLLKNISIP